MAPYLLSPGLNALNSLCGMQPVWLCYRGYTEAFWSVLAPCLYIKQLLFFGYFKSKFVGLHKTSAVPTEAFRLNSSGDSLRVTTQWGSFLIAAYVGGLLFCCICTAIGSIEMS